MNPDQSTTILVIDDSVSNIRVLSALLQDKGEVLFATSGEEGIEIARLRRPHLILLDVEMPEMDGYEVCRRLKNDPNTVDCAVIFVTAHTTPEYEVRALEAGAVDFIGKPFNPPVVRARVHTQLTMRLQAEMLQQLARRDGLTGLYNRRYFDEVIESEWRRHQRKASSLGLAMIDIDHFKDFNDHYGHLEGDACLQQVATTLLTNTRRPGEMVARYGGEEFVAVLPSLGNDDLVKYGDWLLQKIRQLAIPHAHSHVAEIVTISIGMASLVPEASGKHIDLIALADYALYRAKATGRNRLVVAGVDESTAAHLLDEEND